MTGRGLKSILEGKSGSLHDTTIPVRFCAHET